jgi:hypothetical protein
MAYMGAQAKLNVHIASPCAYNMRSQNDIVKLNKAGSYAQARHNVHIASTCAYNMKSRN